MQCCSFNTKIYMMMHIVDIKTFKNIGENVHEDGSLLN